MTFWALFSYLKTHRIAMSVIFCLLVAETAISLLFPYLIGQFSHILTQDTATLNVMGMQLSFNSLQSPDLRWAMGLWIGLLVLQMGLRYQTGFRTNVIGAHVLKALSCQVHDHIQALPLSYFVTRRKGAVLALLSNDVQVVSFFLTGVLTGIVPALLLVVGVAVMLWIVNPSIALVILLSVPLFFVMVKLLGRAIKPLSEHVMQTQAHGVALASENIQQLNLIKAFNRQPQSAAAFRDNAEQLLSLRARLLNIQAFITPFMQLMIALGVLVIVVISVMQLEDNSIDVPQMVTLLLYGALFAKPMGTFAGLYGQIQQAQGAAQRIIALLNTPVEDEVILPALDDVVDPDDATYGHVELNNVAFHYPDQPLLFEDIALRVKPGEIAVIMGRNGRGKTTLLQLMMGFMAPTQGTIFIHGKDISQYSLGSVRRQMGLVSQDIALAHGTIKENVLFGVDAHQVTTDALDEALRISGVTDFTQPLAAGIETHIGENGVRLSGGQRQRIALARALLTQAPILLFDEPTSFADSQWQADFGNMVKTHLSHRTVVIVTHDATLMTFADSILEMSD